MMREAASGFNGVAAVSLQHVLPPATVSRDGWVGEHSVEYRDSRGTGTSPSCIVWLSSSLVTGRSVRECESLAVS